jgi:hypothetical protein
MAGATVPAVSGSWTALSTLGSTPTIACTLPSNCPAAHPLTLPLPLTLTLTLTFGAQARLGHLQIRERQRVHRRVLRGHAARPRHARVLRRAAGGRGVQKRQVCCSCCGDDRGKLNIHGQSVSALTACARSAPLPLHALCLFFDPSAQSSTAPFAATRHSSQRRRALLAFEAHTARRALLPVALPSTSNSRTARSSRSLLRGSGEGVRDFPRRGGCDHRLDDDCPHCSATNGCMCAASEQAPRCTARTPCLKIKP